MFLDSEPTVLVKRVRLVVKIHTVNVYVEWLVPVQLFQALLKEAAETYSRDPTGLGELLLAHKGVLVHQNRSFPQFWIEKTGNYAIRGGTPCDSSYVETIQIICQTAPPKL